MARDPTRRFSDRVEAYVRTRPGYPAHLVDVLNDVVPLGPGTIVAELGAGTGILSGVLARAGVRVMGVEPNDAMREAAATLLADVPEFTAVAGSAEATGLEDASVDGVVAGQAFHWFDPDATATEVRRIVRGDAPWAAMIWNNRRLAGTAFLVAYEAFVREWGTEYARVAATYADPDALRRLFGREPEHHRLDNAQTLDREGMIGRLCSSSYIPAPGQPNHDAMRAAAEAMFDTHADADGNVHIEYDCDVYVGRLA